MNILRRLSVGAAMLLTAAPPLSAARSMRVAVLVDTSAATASAIVQIRAAVAAFIDTLPPESEMILVTTGRRTQVRVPPTTDKAKLKNSASGMLSENGPTALMDALVDVDERFMRKAGERWPVFVILTADGNDSSKEDEQEFNRWLSDVTRRGVSANAIVLKASALGLTGSIATVITRSTHGHYASMGMTSGIPEAMTKLADQLTADAAQRP
jgi:VWA domain-containing protein